MIGVVLSSLASAWILLAGLMDFSTSTALILKKDFSREAGQNATKACLAYGDLLARTKTLDNNPATRDIHPSLVLPAGCLVAENGNCIETISCEITISNDNTIIVSLN